MAKGGRPLFVGVARTADVQRWLRGTSYSEVADIDYAPFKAAYDRAPRHPQARPARQADLLGRAPAATRCTGTSSPATGRSSS